MWPELTSMFSSVMSPPSASLGHSGTCSILHQAKGQAGEDGTLLAGLAPVLAALVLSPAVTLVGAAPVTSLSEGKQHSQLQEGGFDRRSELELGKSLLGSQRPWSWLGQHEAFILEPEQLSQLIMLSPQHQTL